MSQRPSSITVVARLRGEFGSGAFTVAAAKERGFGHQQVQRLARLGLIRRLQRGTYVCEADDVDVRLSIEQARRFDQSGIPTVIAGRSAACIWGMDLPSEVSSMRTVLVISRDARTRRGLRHGLIIRDSHLDPSDFVRCPQGFSVTTPIRTGLDVAGVAQPPWSALWSLISGMRRQVEWQVTGSMEARGSDRLLSSRYRDDRVRGSVGDQAVAALGRRRGWGNAQARRLLPLADIRLESILEARSWWQWSRAGLPMPEPQVWVSGRSGRRYRVDFRWGRVIGEADGAVKYLTARDLWAEKLRQEDLEQAGFVVVRWTWADLARQPDRVVARIRQAMQAVTERSVA